MGYQPAPPLLEGRACRPEAGSLDREAGTDRGARRPRSPSSLRPSRVPARTAGPWPAGSSCRRRRRARDRRGQPVEPPEDGVNGRALLRDEERRLALCGQGGDEVAMVCDLPVPGGPLMTRWAPARIASIAACWVESASRTRCSCSGSGSGSPQAPGAVPPPGPTRHRRAPRRRRGRRARIPAARGRPPWAAWRRRRCRRPGAARS